MDRRDKGRNSQIRYDRNFSPNNHRERAKTWSNGDRERYRRPTISKPTLQDRCNSVAEFEKDDIAAAGKLLSESYHSGQYIQLSVTIVGDENRPKQRRMSRYSSPRHSLQNGLLTPRVSIQYEKSGFRQRTNSKSSFVSSDDSSSASIVGPPKSAWEQFADQIRELHDDSSMCFNQNQKIFKRSDTFVQCCSIMDLKLPPETDINRKESIDIESLYDLPFSNEPRLSTASTCRSAGKGRQDSIHQLNLDVEDIRSR